MIPYKHAQGNQSLTRFLVPRRTKKQLQAIIERVGELLRDNPELRNVKKRKALALKYEELHGPINHETVARFARLWQNKHGYYKPLQDDNKDRDRMQSDMKEAVR